MLKLKLQYFGHLNRKTHSLGRPWFWERLKAKEEEGCRGWDGIIASPILWTWVWASSRSWWWTGKPGVLQFSELQRVRHNWMTELKMWKRPWCWERLKAKEEEGGRGWDGWIASLIQWTWTWSNSRRWWSIGRPGMLQSMGSQSHTWFSEYKWNIIYLWA